jgi:ribosomal protein L21E
MLLHWGDEYLRKVLPSHLEARIKEARVDPAHEMTEPVPYINGATGEVIGSVPSPVINRVSRRKIRRFLTEGQNLIIEVCM